MSEEKRLTETYIAVRVQESSESVMKIFECKGLTQREGIAHALKLREIVGSILERRIDFEYDTIINGQRVLVVKLPNGIYSMLRLYRAYHSMLIEDFVPHIQYHIGDEPDFSTKGSFKSMPRFTFGLLIVVFKDGNEVITNTIF